jgi:hypothetical protein
MSYVPIRLLDARVPPVVAPIASSVPMAYIPFSALQADHRTFTPIPGPTYGYTHETGMGSTNNDGGESSDGSVEDDPLE